jgi:hypothetical protein
MTVQLEWRVAGRGFAHLVDADKTPKSRAGARALCGAYPERHGFAWLSVAPQQATRVLAAYFVSKCPICADRAPAAEPDDREEDR